MNLLFLTLILAGLVYSALGQDFLDQLPSCALNCSSQFLEQELSCSSNDKACLCVDPEALLGGTSVCAGASCTVRDILLTTNSTLAYCDVPQRDNSLTLDVISGVFGGIAVIVVACRMITRMHPFKASFGWDDGFILVAIAFAIFLSANNFVITLRGYGRDIFTILPRNIEHILKWFYVGESIYDICISVTKLSILAFYLRIFPDPSFRRLTFIIMGICTAYLIATVAATIWQCTPISYAWTAWSGETVGHCINVFTLTWIAASTNILLDITIILLPIPVLLKLTLSKKKKFQIVSMFCVGLFITLVSVIRLRSLVQFRATSNFSWDYVGVSYMSTLEVDVGIICACMPAMQLLLRRVAPSIFGSSANNGDSYLHPHTNSRRSRAYRGTNSHGQPTKNITKTITTTVTDMAKDSDSVIELVDNQRQPESSGSTHNVDGFSFATVSTEGAQKPNW